MSESWRRATAAPFGRPHSSPEPQAYTAPARANSASRHHLDAALEFENARLRTKLDQIARDEADREHQRERERRETSASMQRERTVSAMAEGDLKRMAREIRELEGQNAQLRHRIAEVESKASLDVSRAENSVANAKIADADAILRVQGELERAMQDIKYEKDECARLERQCEDLREELRSAGVTITTQNESIRGLTQQMSRLDPYHLIKQQRERSDAAADAGMELQRDLIDKIELLTKQNAASNAERDSAFAELREMRQAAAENDASTQSASRQQQAQLDTAVAALNAKLNYSESEKAQLKAQLAQRDEELNRLSESTSTAEQERLTNQNLKAQVQKLESTVARLQAKVKEEEASHEQDMRDERKAYEAKILQLRGRLSDAEADSLSQEKEVTTMRKKLAAAERRAADAEHDADAAEEKLKKQALKQQQESEQAQQVRSRGGDFGTAEATAPQTAEQAEMKERQVELAAAKEGAAPVDATIRINNCRGLIDRDGGGFAGKSDPYVVVIDPRGKKVLTTATIDESLDPDFEEEGSSVTFPLSTSTPGNITVQVWNWNRMGDDFLGEAVVPVKNIFAAGPGPRTEVLKPRVEEPDQVVHENAHKLGTVAFTVAGIPAVSQAAKDRAVKDRSAATPAVAPPKNVTFAIKACASLLERDGGGWSGKSDPFVEVVDPRGKKVFKTPVMDNTLDPEWDDAETATVAVPLSKGAPGCVTFNVWNHNKLSNDFLGQVAIPIDDVFAYGPGPRKLKLRPRENEKDAAVFDAANELGTIDIEVTGVPAVATKKPLPAYAVDPEHVAPAQAEHHHEIPVRLTVVSGRGLLERDGGGWSGKSDPFVIVKDPRGKQLLKTPRVDDTVNPDWREEKEECTVEPTLSAATPGCITFEVWNYNKLRNDFLGQAQIKVTELFAAGDKTHSMKLKPRAKESDATVHENAHKLGALSFSVSGIDKAGATSEQIGTGPTKEEVKAAQSADVALPKEAPSNVTLRIVSCHDLFDRDGGFSGKSDPFVEVTDPFGKKVLTTPTIDDTLDPTWDKDKATAALKLTPSAKGSVLITVWDWNRISNNVLGQVAVPVADLFTYGPGERVLRLSARSDEKDKDIVERLAAGDALGTITIVVGGVPPPDKVPAKLPAYAIDPSAPLPAAKKPDAVQVTVTVASCEDLLERDGGGLSGKSDPFVIIKAGPGGGKNVLKTAVIDDNLSPEWDAEGSKVTVPIVESAAAGIRFEVWNYNRLSNDFLGECVLTPKQIFSALGAGTHTLPLSARVNEKDETVFNNAHKLGNITFTLAGLPELPTPTPTATPRAPGVGGDAAAAVEKPSVTPPKPYDVEFFVAAGHSLLERDGGGWSGKSDPFVIVNDPRGKKALKTPTIDDELNPKWEKDTATAVIPMSTATPGCVSFEVWNYNKLRNDFLGYASLKVSEVFAAGNKQHVLRLQPRPKESDSEILEKAHELGSLTVFTSGLPVKAAPAPSPPASERPAAVSPASTKPAAAAAAAPKPETAKPTVAEPAPTAKPSAAEAKPAAAPAATETAKPKPATPPPEPPKPKVAKEAAVSVYVPRCKGLMDADGFGRGDSDPYLLFLGPDGKTLLQTAEVSDNLNPEWPVDQATAKLTIPAATRDVAGAAVTVQVWDMDTTGKGDFLGQVVLPVKAFFTNDAAVVGEHTFDLCPREDEPDKTVAKAGKGKLGSMTVVAKAKVVME